MNTDRNKTDIAVAIGKGIVSAAPFVGPLVAEVVGSLIPNQRIDRIARFVEELEAKVAALGREEIKAQFINAQFVDLLEDGFVQASRALSEERLEYLASLMKNSLSQDEINHVEAKRIIGILGELNDVEVIMLRSHLYHPNEDAEFWRRHESALTPPWVHLGSPESEIHAGAIFESHRQHLIRLGLLRQRFRKPRKGELPEFDPKTGMIKANGHEITTLGRILLRYIDQTQPLDAEPG
ncbi:MAG: hypothetical protein WBF17_25030 [Phycisphaerae bacterium]